MREIKFRYWDHFNGCMVYSDSFKNPLEYHYKNISEFFQNLHLAESGENNPVLGQFTGSKDKNGVEIYDGDILQRKKNCLFDEGLIVSEVIFDEGCFCINKVTLKTITDSFSPLIIGNKFENPELLTKKVI